ncbi:hypothetical protein LINPERHAP1_LOCUS41279, partial [Linum perenne]
LCVFPCFHTSTSKQKMATMSASKVTLKLLIDKRTNRVVYGEAGKDFVDFLFTILSLPLGTATKLLSKENKMVGTLGNLYRSIEELSDTYIQPRQRKDRVLNPSVLYCPARVVRLFSDKGLPATMKFYRCSSSSCYSVTDEYHAICSNCKNQMGSTLQFVDMASTNGGTYVPKGEEGGFVKGAVPYMVMDNLEVKPMLTMSIMALFNKMNIKEVGSIEEKVIEVGMAEGLSLLKASLQTESVLTSVFLTVTKLLSKDMVGMMGSLRDLYQSFQGLIDTHILLPMCRRDLYKDRIMNPRIEYCPNSKITSLFSDQGLPAELVLKDGFVNGAATYMVMDNLEVKVMSTVFIMDLFNKKVIHLGTAEGLGLLKASLQTDSVLTTVFLGEPKNILLPCFHTFNNKLLTMASTSSDKVTLKLLIDKRTNRVVYGEAGKDFVDFLLTILMLPLGTATKLLSKDNNTMVGSLGNLYHSIECLSEVCFQMNPSKDRLINPMMDFCPSSRITSLFSDQGLRGQFFRDEGFVNGAATYMVTDNLEVKVMSTVFIMDLFNKMNIKEVGSLQEKVIHLGTAEGLGLLKASLQTEFVLTTVFLGKHQVV